MGRHDEGEFAELVLAPDTFSEVGERLLTTRRAREVRESERQEFIDYVMNFYGPDEPVYDFFDPPVTRAEVERCLPVLIEHEALVDRTHPLGFQALGQIVWDGGSHNREVVRDMMLALRGYDVTELEHQAVVRRLLDASGLVCEPSRGQAVITRAPTPEEMTEYTGESDDQCDDAS